jgi:hypothetical protein
MYSAYSLYFDNNLCFRNFFFPPFLLLSIQFNAMLATLNMPNIPPILQGFFNALSFFSFNLQLTQPECQSQFFRKNENRILMGLLLPGLVFVVLLCGYVLGFVYRKTFSHFLIKKHVRRLSVETVASKTDFFEGDDAHMAPRRSAKKGNNTSFMQSAKFPNVSEKNRTSSWETKTYPFSPNSKRPDTSSSIPISPQNISEYELKSMTSVQFGNTLAGDTRTRSGITDLSGTIDDNPTDSPPQQILFKPATAAAATSHLRVVRLADLPQNKPPAIEARTTRAGIMRMGSFQIKQKARAIVRERFKPAHATNISDGRFGSLMHLLDIRDGVHDPSHIKSMFNSCINTFLTFLSVYYLTISAQVISVFSE